MYPFFFILLKALKYNENIFALKIQLEVLSSLK